MENLFSYLLLNENSSIKDALICIKNNGSRHVFITSDNNRVIGIISEGDVISALLKGSDLSSRLLELVNNSFIYVSKSDTNDKTKILRILKQGILIIPVLDDEMKLVDVINYLDYLD
tara:strand:- start:24608 stop:24958 length:351 start_codon:yes stop_codon:yes gene_type:complete